MATTRPYSFVIRRPGVIHVPVRDRRPRNEPPTSTKDAGTLTSEAITDNCPFMPSPLPLSAVRIPRLRLDPNNKGHKARERTGTPAGASRRVSAAGGSWKDVRKKCDSEDDPHAAAAVFAWACSCWLFCLWPGQAGSSCCDRRCGGYGARDGEFGQENADRRRPACKLSFVQCRLELWMLITEFFSALERGGT